MKLLHILIAIIALTAFQLFSRASADTVVYLHTVSYHANRTANFNEENYGIGVRHNVDNKPYQYINVGTYHNSERNTSNYIGVGYQWEVGELNLGINVGVITGYTLGDVLPYVLPTVRYKNVALVFVPYPEAVVHLTADVWQF